MKSTTILAGVAAIASTVSAHATWQDLWVAGKDQGSTCARLPNGNSPVTDVTSKDIRCNANKGPAASKCAVAAGQTVTIEMHQQNGDRSCSTEAIGGAHYGPVQVYLSKVSDALTADGSSSFFKIFQDTWAQNPSGGGGSDDYWGTKDLNLNCGKMDLKIPTDLAPGDYLLRAEAIALHSAAGVGGAQFYVTCFQLTVTGSGSSAPAGVSFPGAYKATDPGIQINIYQKLTSYTAPGPAIIAGGTEAKAGSGGSVVTGSPAPVASATKEASTMKTSVKTSAAPAPTSGGCSVAKYQQCGGNGFTGCKTCASGMTCVAQGDYYSQCN